MYTRIDIKITFRCNNKCDFCAQGHKRDVYADRSRARVYAELAAAYKKGVRGVVFTGGEPMLHPLIMDFTARAKELGYKTIQLQTNGRAFTYKGLLEKLKKAGANELGPSLHGAKPGTHDALTHAPGSFLQTLTGIKTAAQMGFKVITNSVITELNYRELPELASLLVRAGASQYQFAFIHIVGTALENKKWIVPRKTAVMPWVKKALDIGIKNKVPCFTEAIPFCLMKGYENCVAESTIPAGPVVDADRTIKDYSVYRKTEGKAKGPLCPECRHFAVCEGPWREYPELYGWKEFTPVRDTVRSTGKKSPSGKARRN
jgi:MoaA/NifB/PqqE/SkfB family radical SAM enzyme